MNNSLFFFFFLKLLPYTALHADCLHNRARKRIYFNAITRWVYILITLTYSTTKLQPKQFCNQNSSGREFGTTLQYHFSFSFSQPIPFPPHPFQPHPLPHPISFPPNPLHCITATQCIDLPRVSCIDF